MRRSLLDTLVDRQESDDAMILSHWGMTSMKRLCWLLLFSVLLVVSLSIASCGTFQSGVSGPSVLGSFTSPGETTSSNVANEYGVLSSKDAVVWRGSFGDNYSFFGTAGEQVEISLTSSTIDSYVYLHDGSGRLIAEDDDSGEDWYDSFLTVSLPHDGLYIITASSYYDSDEGPYHLRVTRGEMIAQYPELVVSSTNDLAFTWETPTDYQGNPFLVFAVFLEAGVPVQFQMSSTEVDSVLYVFDPNGLLAGHDDDSGGYPNAYLGFTPTISGHHFLVASSVYSTAFYATGSFQLEIGY